MFLSSLSHQRVSLLVLVILLVIRTAQSVGSNLECLTQKTVRAKEAAEAPASFQQLSQPGSRDVEYGAHRDGALHADGSLRAQEKVVMLLGKALKGKIDEYSE